jgi:hypothetical protein
MQAAEALQLMILEMDKSIAAANESEVPVDTDELERKNLAIGVSQAMLNSMIPVARFRAFVEVDEEQPKRTKGEQARAIHDEFTVCAVYAMGIVSGLIGLSQVPTNVRVLVFEQRATGADVVSGFQGTTKSQKWRIWLKELPSLEAASTAVN